ncbi:MAG: DUF2878 domain-containing protein [Opitutae bacterium]|jgi:hypothetical protein|nr:DUF2878 domain-containing protein [Opitutae bacterium]
MNAKLSFIVDLVIFQIAWFCCVLATKTPIPELAPYLGVTLVLIRVVWTARFRTTLPFLTGSLLIGIPGDAFLVQVELLHFQPYPNLFGSPMWMVLLWTSFGLMLRPVFTWFLDHCMRSIIGFSIGGAVAYWSGERLEVLTFTNGWLSIAGVAGIWAIAGVTLRYLHLKFPDSLQNEHT